MSLTKVTYSMIKNGYVNVQDYGATGDGVTNDYNAIVAAKTICGTTGAILFFPKGNYFIGTNELVFSESGLVIECEADVEIQGNGALDDGHVVSFASAGGSAQPGSTHPTNQRVTGLRVRTVAPFSSSGNGGRAGIRVCGSYNTFIDCSITTSDDVGGNGLRLEADNTGSGPYYNTFIECNIQGPQDGTDTGIGITMRQKAGTSVSTRYPNTNTFTGGRVGGYAVGVELRGEGNKFFGIACENYPSYGTAFKWDAPVAASNVSNTLFSPYIENASVAFDIEANTATPQIHNYSGTGITTLIADPSNRLTLFGQDGVRDVRLASAPNPFAARSGIYVGNTNNTDAETLDWYKEGTWTPTLAGGSSAGSYTISTTSANYTRVGNLVHVSASMDITINSAGTGTATFDGLPFAKSNGSVFKGAISVTNTTLNASIQDLFVQPQTSGSSTQFVLAGNRSGNTPLFINVTDFSSGANVTVDFTYFV